GPSGRRTSTRRALDAILRTAAGWPGRQLPCTDRARALQQAGRTRRRLRRTLRRTAGSAAGGRAAAPTTRWTDGGGAGTPVALGLPLRVRTLPFPHDTDIPRAPGAPGETAASTEPTVCTPRGAACRDRQYLCVRPACARGAIQHTEPASFPRVSRARQRYSVLPYPTCGLPPRATSHAPGALTISSQNP